MKINFNKDKIFDTIVIGGVSIVLVLGGVLGHKKSNDTEKNTNTKSNKQYSTTGEVHTSIDGFPGYTLSEDGAYAYKETKDYVTNYMAPMGYTLEEVNGEMKASREIVEMYPIEDSSDEFGPDFQVVMVSGKKYAQKKVKEYVNPIMVINNGEMMIINGVTYAAPNGYTLQLLGNNEVVAVRKTTYSEDLVKTEVDGEVHYEAPAGYSVVNGKAVREVVEYTSPIIVSEQEKVKVLEK